MHHVVGICADFFGTLVHSYLRVKEKGIYRINKRRWQTVLIQKKMRPKDIIMLKELDSSGYPLLAWVHRAHLFSILSEDCIFMDRILEMPDPDG